MNQADGDLRLELAIAPASGGGASLVSLQIRRLDGSGVKVTPQGQDFVASALAAATRKQVRVIHGQMDNQSFYSSAVASGLSDSVIPAFFQAFVYDFDFQREIEPGDVFEAAFEENLNDQSEVLGAPNLLYASMTTKAKSRALYAFAPAGAKSVSWFDGAGHANQRSLMKTPVEGARISSTFGMRFHPVLGFTRMHKGTDFATPIGTPVFASGDGKVVFAGLHGDHGNYIQIQHTPTLATAYAHLSKFQDGITVGTQVSQGQQIALSGNSGLSSGPHVHYEVIVNGEQVDSQTYQTGEGKSLAGDDLKAFLRERDRIDAVRATAL
jgi:murein DD-endopeptidase MepM/ murein hydrolase activator NlpD